MSDPQLPARRLDARGLEEVLRRAVELEQRNSDAQPEFSVDDAVRIAGEIGVGEEAVRGALVLVERDALMRPETPPGRLDRWFGAARVICARNVPGPAREVRRIVGKVLSDQLFRVRRNLQARVIWERSDSFFAGVRRAFDFDDRYRLTEVEQIEVMINEAASPGRVDVRIVLDFSELRSSRLKKGVIWPALLGGSMIAGAIALGPAAVGAYVLAGGGVATGTAVHMRMRSRYQRSVDEAQQAVERLLDSLEHER